MKLAEKIVEYEDKYEKDVTSLKTKIADLEN